MRRRRGFSLRPHCHALPALAAFLLSLFATADGYAQSDRLETAVKATYLVKFAGFVEWPATAFPSSSSPLNICIIGMPLGGLADRAAADQLVGQHSVAVRHLPAAGPAANCHILFTAGSPEQPVAAALDAVRREPTLTVTDLPSGAHGRGIINFVPQAGHVRFEIDERQAAQAGLRISSQLLALAVNLSAR
jgi:uncharacterized protein DUF4154